jgi:hypothetical protein
MGNAARVFAKAPPDRQAVGMAGAIEEFAKRGKL